MNDIQFKPLAAAPCVGIAKEAKATPEARYWNKFKKYPSPLVEPSGEASMASVSHVRCCGSSPFDFAITYGTRVKVFSGKKGTLKKSFNRWGGAAYSGVLRDSDGKLIAAGNDSGAVRVFNVQGSGASLRNLKGHTRATKVVRWGVDGTRLYTGSDDRTVRCWDIATGDTVTKFSGHGDYVRCVAVGASMGPSSDSDLCVTGSYDHIVRVWDARAGSEKKPSLSFDHGAPVESLLPLKGGSLVLSSGSNEIKVWDVLKGGAPIATFSNSQKTITSMCSDGTGTRIFAGSLDGHVKIYDVSTFEMVFSYQCDYPVLSVDVSKDSSHVVVGMDKGGLEVRAKASKPSSAAAAMSRIAPRSGSRRHFLRGLSTKASANDFKVMLRGKAKLQVYDVFLKKFQYQEALDAVLRTRQPAMVVSMFSELISRAALVRALAGRDETSLEPILAFLVKFATNPRYADLLCEVCEVIVSIYAPIIGTSMVIDDLFLKLHQHLKQELGLHKKLLKLSGKLDLCMF